MNPRLRRRTTSSPAARRESLTPEGARAGGGQVQRWFGDGLTVPRGPADPPLPRGFAGSPTPSPVGWALCPPPAAAAPGLKGKAEPLYYPTTVGDTLVYELQFDGGQVMHSTEIVTEVE